MGKGDSSSVFANSILKRDATIVVAVTAVSFVVVQGDDVWGMWPFSQQRKRSLWSGSRMAAHGFSTWGGIPSFPGALPQMRQLMAFLSSFTVGISSSSPKTDKPGRALRAALFDGYVVLGLVQLEVVLHLALNLFTLVCDDFTCLCFE